MFPSYVSAGFAEHHHQFWRWVWALRIDVRPETSPVLLWPRGGAKSTSVELACAAVAARGTRSYVLYISGTQKQADDHVANVARLLESEAIGRHYPKLGERKLDKFGSSLGWRRNRVMTSSGFILDALGLEGAARGVKLDEHRPDLFALDDIDDVRDSMETIEKNIVTLTQSLLPAEAPTAGAVFVQNLVHHESIAARLAGLASESAEFLADRVVSGPIPAVVGLQTEPVPGTILHRVTGGTATWAGQDLATCERQINRWSLRAFLAEAQHEKSKTGLEAFPEWDVSVHVCDPFKIPEDWPKWRAVDYGYAVPYCCLWFTRSPSGRLYIYRETYGAGKTALQQGYDVRLASSGERYFCSVGDPAMWASEREGEKYKSPASQYAEMGVSLEQASNNRIAGWGRLHELLAHGEGVPPILQVFKTCHNLIRTFPDLKRHPQKPDDVDCWVAGTQISTPRGDIPIEQISIGDLVDTPIGPRRVLRSYVSGASATIRVTLSDGLMIEGTPHHKVYVQGAGLVPLESLKCYDILKERNIWLSRWLSIAVSSIAAMRGVCTTTRMELSSSTAVQACIDRSGLMQGVRFLLSGMFTTLMTTMTTTSFLTSSACRQGSMASTTMNEESTAISGKRSRRGETVMSDERPYVRTAENYGNECQSGNVRADIVAVLLRLDTLVKSIAYLPVASSTIAALTGRLRWNAPSAGEPWQSSGTPRSKRRPVHIVAVGRSDDKKLVFNLTVDEAHLFYANGILSSNTDPRIEDHAPDTARYGLMAAHWLDALKKSKPQSYMGGRR